MADLITLARAKEAIAEVSGTTYDDVLANLIDSATKAIEKRCRRVFASTAHDLLYDGPGSSILLLDHFPIISVERVASMRSVALRIENTDNTVNQRATVAVLSTGLKLVRVASGVTTTDSSVTWTANATVTAVATAVTALGSGWSGEVASDFGKFASAELKEIQGALFCLRQKVDIDVFDEELNYFTSDADAGELQGWFPAGKRNIRVQHTAGWATVPEDIQEACALLVASWFRERSRDSSLASYTLGDESWSARQDSGAGGLGGFPKSVATLIAPYVDRK